MAGNYTSGQGGNITANGIIYAVTTWHLSPAAEAYDTTNTSSENFMEHAVSGPLGFSGTASAFYDTVNVPCDAGGLNLIPGESFNATFDVGETGTQWEGMIVITETPTENPAKGTVTYGISFVSTGEFTSPGD